MGQRHLVVADDAVVKVGDVESAVRPEGGINRPEPRIGGSEEIGLLGGLRCGPVEGDGVAVQPAGHHVADEERVAIFGGPKIVVVVHSPVDGRAAVGVLEHHRCEAESVVGLAKTGIPTSGQQLVKRRTVAVAGIEVSAGIPSQTKRIHLTVRVVLDPGTVEADAVGVARIQIHMTAVAGRDMGIVVEPVGRIEPAIETAAERGLVAMGIPGVVEGSVQRGPLVGLAVAIGVLEQPNVGDAPDERLPMAVVGAEGIHPDGNIQAVGKLGHLAGATVWTKILEDHYPVPTDPVGGRGPRVFDTGRDPKPTRRIEGEVHGLVDVGLVGHQLNFESGR